MSGMGGMNGMNYAQMFAMSGLTTGAQVPLLPLNPQFTHPIPIASAMAGVDFAGAGKKRRKKLIEEGHEPPKRQRSRKPPDAPRRPKSAYMFFLAEFRESWKVENPTSKKVADVAKAAGEAWRAMPDEQKAGYEEHSTAAKQAYAKAMQAYEEAHPKPVRRPQKIRDPAELKRPQSAYFFFLADFREDYKKDHPNNQVQVSILGKLAGERWKMMSEEEKAPYEVLSSASKAEYAKQKMLTPDERRMYASMQSLQAMGGGGTAAAPLLSLQPGAPTSHFPFGTTATAMAQVSVSMPQSSGVEVSGLQHLQLQLQNFQHLQLLQNLQNNHLQAAQVHAAQQAQAQAVQAHQQAQVQAHMQAQVQADAQAQGLGMSNHYAAVASQAQQAVLMQSMLAHQVQALGQGSPVSTGLQQLAASLGGGGGMGHSAAVGGAGGHGLPAGHFGLDGQMAHSLLSNLGGLGAQQMQQVGHKLDGHLQQLSPH